jgi:2-dehydro-3-deoxygluconokinase
MAKTPDKIVCIGEAMVEFAANPDGSWQQGFAGDTLNVAWYLSALSGSGRQIEYLTRLGVDGFSDRMINFMRNGNIGTAFIKRDAARKPGLYTIETDERGERSFAYWRGQSAARHLADDVASLEAALKVASLVYFSGITLAIIGREGRRNLLSALSQCRQNGSRIAFDPNARPALWQTPEEMRSATMEFARLCDVILPTFDDEAAVFGDASLQATLKRYSGAGCKEIAVKDGTRPVFWQAGGKTGKITIEHPLKPVDTTGAGDSFNGGYLAARFEGRTVEQAIQAGQRVACRVVMQRGALVPRAAITEAVR